MFFLLFIPLGNSINSVKCILSKVVRFIGVNSNSLTYTINLPLLYKYTLNLYSAIRSTTLLYVLYDCSIS